MIRFTRRQLAITLILTASTSLTAVFASDPPPDPPAMAYTVPDKGIKDYIRKAVESPTRSAEAKSHDFYRKPAQMLKLADIRPGKRVVELSAYGNYYSGMLSDIVGPKGELHIYDMPFAKDVFDKSEQAFVAAHPNTTYQNVDFGDIDLPRNVDVVWCVECFHELLLTGVDLSPFQAKLYKAMKPGATLLIAFYTARDSTETDDTGKLHRIDPATVRSQLQSAGFTLLDEDRMLNNHDDDKTWPVLTEGQRDQADRTVYRFRK